MKRKNSNQTIFLLLLATIISASFIIIQRLNPTVPKVAAASTSIPSGNSISTIKVKTPKGDFNATVMTINLSTAKMITDTASDSECTNNCPLLSLKSFIERNAGFAGVNATYFCPASYSECSSKKDSFDFSVFNSRGSKWINKSTLSWGGRGLFYVDKSGQSSFMPSPAGIGENIEAGLTNYPILLRDGNIQIDDNQSGLSAKQKSKGTKLAIGSRDSKTILVVRANSVTTLEFAHVLKTLGMKSALNLDSGGSIAIMFGGKFYAGPGRNLPNAIIFARR